MSKKACRPTTPDLEPILPWTGHAFNERPYSSQEMLIALVEETPNSTAATMLLEYGFDLKQAKIELQKLKDKQRPDFPPPEWYTWYVWGLSSVRVFEHARKLAGVFCSKSISTEHLLLAVIQRHQCGAYELMGKLGINRNRLENELVKRLRTEARTVAAKTDFI